MLSSKSKVFKYLLLCFIGGGGFASFFSFDLFFVFFLFFGATILAAIFWRQSQSPYWLFIGGLVVIAGIWRYQISWPQTDSTKIWFYNGQTKIFQGLVVAEPDRRFDQTKMVLAVKKIDDLA